MISQLTVAQAIQQLNRGRGGRYAEKQQPDPGPDLLDPSRDLYEDLAIGAFMKPADKAWQAEWDLAVAAEPAIFERTYNADDPQAGVDAAFEWARRNGGWHGEKLRIINELVARRYFDDPEQAAVAAALARFDQQEADEHVGTPIHTIDQVRPGYITHVGRGVDARRCDECGKLFFTNGYVLYSAEMAQHRLRRHGKSSGPMLPL